MTSDGTDQTKDDSDRTPAAPASTRHLSLSRLILILLVLMSLMLPFLKNTGNWNHVYTVWHEVLAVNLLAAIAGLLTACRRRGQAVPWRDLLLWCTVSGMLIFIYVQRAMSSTIAWSLMIGLRLAIAGLWLFVVFGLPAVVLLIRRRRRLNAQRFSVRQASEPLADTWMYWWFSATLMLIMTEASCLVLWNLWQTPIVLTFPEQLPDPPSDELHLAAIGGSTTLGWPYHPHYSFVDVAGWQLEQLIAARDLHQRDSSNAADDSGVQYKKVVVHNLAQAGDALKQDIQHLHQLPVRPQALLVYTGHNELYHEVDHVTQVKDSLVPAIDRMLSRSPAFRVADGALVAHFSSLWRLRQLSRTLVDEPYLTEELKAQRLATFRYRLKLLAEFCQRQQIHCVWFIPAASEADCPPNRSITDSRATPQTRNRLNEIYREAQHHESRNDWSSAAEAYRQGLQDQPEFAEFQFLLGRCLIQLRQFDAARESLQAALEHDAYPVRAQTDHREAILQVAAEFSMPAINAGDLLRRQTSHGILDRSIILDDVHPNLKGHFVLGIAAAARLSTEFGFPQLQAAGRNFQNFKNSLDSFQIAPEALAAGYRTLAGVLQNRARLRFDETHWQNLERQLRAAAEKLSRSDELPDDTGIEILDEPVLYSDDNI